MISTLQPQPDLVDYFTYFSQNVVVLNVDASEPSPHEIFMFRLIAAAFSAPREKVSLFSWSFWNTYWVFVSILVHTMQVFGNHVSVKHTLH